jgi:hypothetical protein
MWKYASRLHVAPEGVSPTNLMRTDGLAVARDPPTSYRAVSQLIARCTGSVMVVIVVIVKVMIVIVVVIMIIVAVPNAPSQLRDSCGNQQQKNAPACAFHELNHSGSRLKPLFGSQSSILVASRSSEDQP